MYGVEKISGPLMPEKTKKKWHYNKKVLATFAHHTSQSAWANMEGLGGRRLQPGTSDGVTNMFATLCGATANNRKVHVYADDKLIYTIYLV
jgi:hypothetical protein